MKYISLDTEFTNLKVSHGNLLQVALLICDTDVKPEIKKDNFLNIAIYPPGSSEYKPLITGHPIAITMNSNLINMLGSIKLPDGGQTHNLTPDEKIKYRMRNDIELVRDYEDAASLINNFLKLKMGVFNPDSNKEPIVIAGKNVAIDLQYLNTYLKGWNSKLNVSSRRLDPGQMYIDWETDNVPPSLKTCLDRAGIGGEVTHDALSDALDVAKLVNKYVKHNYQKWW